MSRQELLAGEIAVGMVIEAGVKVGTNVIRKECCVEGVRQLETSSGPRTHVNGRHRLEAGGWSRFGRRLQRPWVLIGEST